MLRHHRLQHLLHPAFLLSLGLLLLNDHLLKGAFHNWMTGKVSDFTGLFALAWIGLCFLPRAQRIWLPLLGLLFVWWKSPLSSPAIATFNALEWMQIGRVVDASDLIALTMLPLVAIWFSRLPAQAQAPSPAIRLTRVVVVTVASLAFVATSKISQWEYKEKFPLPYPVTEAVSRLNQLNVAKGFANLPLSTHHENANKYSDEGIGKIYLHHNGTPRTVYDTTFVLEGDSLVPEDISNHQEDVVDSMYLSPEGLFRWMFSIPKSDDPEKSGACGAVSSLLELKPKGQGCELVVRRLSLSNCYLFKPDGNSQSEEEYILEQFKLHVLAQLQP